MDDSSGEHQERKEAQVGLTISDDEDLFDDEEDYVVDDKEVAAAQERGQTIDDNYDDDEPFEEIELDEEDSNCEEEVKIDSFVPIQLQTNTIEQHSHSQETILTEKQDSAVNESV